MVQKIEYVWKKTYSLHVIAKWRTSVRGTGQRGLPWSPRRLRSGLFLREIFTGSYRHTQSPKPSSRTTILYKKKKKYTATRVRELCRVCGEEGKTQKRKEKIINTAIRVRKLTIPLRARHVQIQTYVPDQSQYGTLRVKYGPTVFFDCFQAWATATLSYTLSKNGINSEYILSLWAMQRIKWFLFSKSGIYCRDGRAIVEDPTIGVLMKKLKCRRLKLELVNVL